MATNARSIYANETEKAQLNEAYGGVISVVQKQALSIVLKSQNYTGSPTDGSVKFKRTTNATSKDYGTARLAAKGTSLKIKPIVCNLDMDKEIVEEINMDDLNACGIPDLLQRRKTEHISSMIYELDNSFFNQAIIDGNEFSPSAMDIKNIVKEGIEKIEKTKTDYSNSVNRSDIRVVLDSLSYDNFNDEIDKNTTNKTDMSAGENFVIWHGVKIYPCSNLPGNIKAIFMLQGSIGQPCVSTPYDMEKIGLSNDVAIELFYHYGTVALTAEYIYYVRDDDGVLDNLVVTSVEGATAGTTRISVTGADSLARKLVYKINSTTAPTVAYNQVLNVGWTVLKDIDITTTSGHKITVAQVTTDNKAKASGTATAVVKV